MSESDDIVVALKKALKASGKTYQDVAVALGLTSSSVKRLFSEKSFSLQRLEAVCELASISLTELVQSAHAIKFSVEQLTLEQEREIAEDRKLLLVLFLVLNHYTFNEILEGYKLSNTECIRLLAKLDKIRLIELMPNNRIKLQIGPNFSWIPDGPIQQFFQNNFQNAFFNSRFTADGELLIGINAMLTRESNMLLQDKLKALSIEFSNLAKENANTPLEDRKVNSLVLAIRAWQPPLFDELRRE